MNEFLIGQRCRYAGLDVVIRSIRAPDGKYTVEDRDGSFFRAHHDRLTAAGIKAEFEGPATSFQNIASRAAMSTKGRVKGKSRQR